MKRINFFTYLNTDAQEWITEQDYHKGRADRHQVRVHGWGIVDGLRVQPTAPASMAVVVAPGFAIDSDGRDLAVSAAAEISLAPFIPAEGTQVVYIVVEYKETESDPVFVDELAQLKNKYINEIVAIKAQTSPPTLPQLELARVNLGVATTELTEPVDPANPGINEMDRRAVRYSKAREHLAFRFKGAAPPLNPEEGDFWYDTANHIMKYWNGTAWT